MHKKYNVFLSLLVVLVIGVLIDIYIVDNQPQEQKNAFNELEKNSYSNIKVYGTYGDKCKGKFNFRKYFQAQKDGKVYSGGVCSNKTEVSIHIDSISQEAKL